MRLTGPGFTARGKGPTAEEIAAAAAKVNARNERALKKLAAKDEETTDEPAIATTKTGPTTEEIMAAAAKVNARNEDAIKEAAAKTKLTKLKGRVDTAKESKLTSETQGLIKAYYDGRLNTLTKAMPIIEESLEKPESEPESEA